MGSKSNFDHFGVSSSLKSGGAVFSCHFAVHLSQGPVLVPFSWTMPSFSVGQRVVTISSADAASKTDNSSAALERGTVRYVGEVAGTKGEWIGVEWDDEGRGRHDGPHDGKRYFSVRESAASSG